MQCANGGFVHLVGSIGSNFHRRGSEVALDKPSPADHDHHDD
jgi:hypothetical protein